MIRYDQSNSFSYAVSIILIQFYILYLYNYLILYIYAYGNTYTAIPKDTKSIAFSTHRGSSPTTSWYNMIGALGLRTTAETRSF